MGARPIGSGGSRRLPGIYAATREAARKAAAEPDPRLALVADEASRQRQIEAEREELRRFPERRWRKTVLDIEALERGEPVLIPKWLVGGAKWPQARSWPEFRDSEVTMYMMYPDDHLVPMYGEESQFASRREACAATHRYGDATAKRRHSPGTPLSS